MEAYDVSQGPEWADGLNRIIPHNVLVSGCQANVRKDWGLLPCHRAAGRKVRGGERGRLICGGHF